MNTLVCIICSVMSDSLQPHGFPATSPGSFVHGLLQARILERGCHFLFQKIFLTRRSNRSLLCLLHCRQILYCWDTGEAQTPLVSMTRKLWHRYDLLHNTWAAGIVSFSFETEVQLTYHEVHLIKVYNSVGFRVMPSSPLTHSRTFPSPQQETPYLSGVSSNFLPRSLSLDNH